MKMVELKNTKETAVEEQNFCIPTFRNCFIREDNSKKFQLLSEFVNAAKEFNSGAFERDVVSEYLHVSSDCQEYVNLLAMIPECHPHQVAIIFSFGTCILTRIATDFNHLSNVAGTIVTELLRCASKNISQLLRSDKNARIAVVLNLIGSMIIQGPVIAREVFTRLNMSTPFYTTLFSKSNPQEVEDVRSLFINVISLFLSVADNSLICQIIQVKGFLHSIFPNMKYDRAPVIILILKTFASKIVNNTSVSKTSKVRFFNEYALGFILKLYNWKGPLQIVKSKKRKLGNSEEAGSMDTSQEDIANVRNAVHEFMLNVCCSYKKGIIFRDPMCGISGNHNQVMTNALKNWQSPYADVNMSHLVVSILTVCPDQIRHYLPHLKDSFVPRLSASWFQAMIFIEKLFQRDDVISLLFEAKEKYPTNKLIPVAKVLCVPTVISAEDFGKSLEEQHIYVCHYLLKYLNLILKQVKQIYDYCLSLKENALYSTSELKKFYFEFIAAIKKELPNCLEVENYWIQTVSNGVIKEDHEAVVALQGFQPRVSFPDLLSEIIEILTLYQRLRLKPASDVGVTFKWLFEGLKTCSSRLSESEIQGLKLKLVNFFIGEGTSNTYKMNKDLCISFVPLILEAFISTNDETSSSKVKEIACKLFKNYFPFSGQPWEIPLWLDTLKQYKLKHQEKLVLFLGGVFEHLLKKDCVVVSGQVEEKLKDTNSAEMNHFSSIVSTSLQFLGSECNDFKVCKKYMESVLNGIIHRLPNPNALYSEINKVEHLFNSDTIFYWKFLFDFHPQAKNTERIYNLEDVDDLRRFFVYFNTASQESRSDISVHKDVTHKFETLAEELTELQLYQKSNFVWMLCTYIKLEADRLFSNKEYLSAIPLYINLLNLLCLEKNEHDSTEEIKGTEEQDLIFNVLSHPGITATFLPMGVTYNDQSIQGKLVLEVVWEFVFDIFKVLTLSNFSVKQLDSMISPLKCSALAFLQRNIGPIMTDNIEVKFGVFRRTVTIFSNFFTRDEVVTLLLEVLSIKDNLYVKLDSKSSVIACLAGNKHLVEDYCVLPPDLVNSLISKCFSEDLKRKHRRALKEILVKWIEIHPLYSLSVSESALEQLMMSKYAVDVKLLNLIISHDLSKRKTVKSLVNFEEQKQEKDIKLFAQIVIPCIYVYQKPHRLQNVGQFIYELIIREFCTYSAEKLLAPLDDLPQAVCVLVTKSVFDSKRVKQILKNMCEPSVCQNMDVDKILISIKLLIALHGHEELLHLVPCRNMLKIAFSWIQIGFGMDDKEKLSSFYSTVLDFSHHCIENAKLEHLQKIFPDFSLATTFLVSAIELSINDVAIGVNLLKIVNAVICRIFVQSGNSSACFVCYKEIISKDYVNMVLMSSGSLYKQVKGLIIQCMLMLWGTGTLEIALEENPDILKSYGASMSFNDQQALCFLKKLDESYGISGKYSLLWGESRNTKQPNTQSNHLLRNNQPNLKNVLALLDAKRLQYTAYNFPLHLPFEIKFVETLVLNQESDDDVQWDEVYDPRFLLHVLCSILSPGCFVNCRDFISSGLLGIVFTSLSSYDANIRALGYYCLSQFYSHLQHSTYAKRLIWICLLDNLRNSITSSNEKLPFVITLFLAKVVDIFQNPECTMYIPICKFLTVKPVLDVRQLPEFYKLFNSLGLDHRLQRDFILNLLSEGLRTSLDFHICEKRYIFTVILPYYSSPLSTVKEKLKILKIVQAAVRVPSSAKKMCQSGLLGWLSSVIQLTNRDDQEKLTAIVDLMHTLAATYLSLELCTAAEVAEFQLVHLYLLNYLSSVDMCCLKKYIKTLLKVYSFSEKTCPKQNGTIDRCYVQPLQTAHIDALFKCWSSKTTLSDMKLRSSFLDNKQPFQIPEYIFGDVILLWKPVWNDLDIEETYQSTINSFMNVLHILMRESLINFMTKPYFDWFVHNVHTDERLGIFKTMLSSEPRGQFCSESFLQLCELQWMSQSLLTRWHSILSMFVDSCSARIASEPFCQTLNNFTKHFDQFKHHSK